MKGVINKGVQELVESQFGQDAWEAIRCNARCDEASFSPGIDYPDQMTVDLIVAASEHLNLTADDVMIAFGKYWVANTGAKSYPTLFALAGGNSKEFLRNMDRVHRQVTVSIEGAHPPPLTPEELPDGGLAIHYQSQRKLCPVLHGLILGVGIYCDEALSVKETKCMRSGDTECTFEVSFG
jgi:predicted hydrocarbon binding protein